MCSTEIYSSRGYAAVTRRFDFILRVIPKSTVSDKLACQVGVGNAALRSVLRVRGTSFINEIPDRIYRASEPVSYLTEYEVEVTNTCKQFMSCCRERHEMLWGFTLGPLIRSATVQSFEVPITLLLPTKYHHPGKGFYW